MNDISLRFVRDFVRRHRNTRRDTIQTLDKDDALAFIHFHMDCMELGFAIHDEYLTTVRNSLVALVLVPIQKALDGMHFDFLNGRYAEVGRTLRFVWELLFRSYYAEVRSGVEPNHPTAPDEMLEWLDLQSRRRKLSWHNVFRPVIESLFCDGKQGKAAELFRPSWNRLNEVAHPSVTWLLSGLGESTRITFDHFDRELALRLLDDAREVFGIMWFAVLHRFPNITPNMAKNPHVFVQTPQLRSIVDNTRHHQGRP